MNTTRALRVQCGLFVYRALARMADYAVYMSLFYVILWCARHLSARMDRFLSLPNMANAVANLSFCFLYYPLLETFGATPGKRLLGLQTERTGLSHKPIGIVRAYIKTALQFGAVPLFYYMIITERYEASHNSPVLFQTVLALLVITLLSPASMIFHPLNCTPHDIISDSTVVKV